MAKKGFIKDLNNIEMLPITRGELVLDSSGKLALHSNEFLATDSLPGLMSKEDKAKLDKVNENGDTIDLVSATTDGLAPKIGTAAASTVTTQADEWVLTSTKGATPTWRKLPTNAFLNYYRPILINGTSLLGNNNTALNIVAGTNINLTTDAGKVTINNGLTKLSLLTDDILSGKYLPLTGGIIINTSNAPLYVATSSGGWAGIAYKNNTGTLGYIGVQTTHPVFVPKDLSVAYKIWHAGNDGEGSGLDADTLDGKHLNKIFSNEDWSSISGVTDANQPLFGAYYFGGTTQNMPNTYGQLIAFNGLSGEYGGMQLFSYSNKLHYRNHWNDKWGEWRQLAFIDSNITGNAASADKVKNSLILKINSGITEDTDLYTYDGSSTKTLDIKWGTGIKFVNTQGSLQIYNSGVRSISTGITNGTIRVNTDGTSIDVPVKGLGSAAYTDYTDYAVAKKLGTNTDLNNVIIPGFYNAAGGNAIVNKPRGVEHFGLEVIHGASGAYYIQILYPQSYSNIVWRRHCINGTWSTWTLDLLTDTTYTFTSGTAGNFTVTPKGGTAQTVSIGKPATAGTADVADKLKTKRKIWGLDFDGTADVSGNMTGVGSITASGTIRSVHFYGKLAKGGALFYFGIRDGLAVGIEPVDADGNWLNNGILLFLNGNVSIGTVTNSEKLYVNGNVKATSFIGNLDWSYITNKPTSFTPAAHDHTRIINTDTSGRGIEGTLLPSKFEKGLTFNTIYGGNTKSWPVNYGNVVTIRGNGDNLIVISWNANQTETNTNVALEMYIRSKRDSAAGDQWSDWTRVITDRNYSEYCAPKTHTHTSNQITALTGYTKATSASDLVATDTLNTALGKLEYKAGIAYSWYRTITEDDTDEIINKWSEIVGFLDSVKEGTDILDEFVTRKTALTITGPKTFNSDIIMGTAHYIYGINENSGAMLFFDGARTILGSVGTSSTSNTHIRSKNAIVTIGTGNAGDYTILHSGNSHIKNGVITINGTSITPLTAHQSLANYVTLNTALTISGVKTFSTLLKFTVAQGTSPFTVTSTTKVINLNADFLDDYHVTSLVRKSEMANNSSFNANNMTTDLVIYTSKGDVGSNASVWDNFGASKPAGGFSLFHIKEGGYARQLLGVYNDRHLYTRSQYHSNGAVWSSWSTIALTSDIPKVTDYYWANVKISSTSSTTTTPIFGLVNTPGIKATADTLSLVSKSGYIYLRYNGNDNTSVCLTDYAFIPTASSNEKLNLGGPSNRWHTFYSVNGDFKGKVLLGRVTRDFTNYPEATTYKMGLTNVGDIHFKGNLDNKGNSITWSWGYNTLVDAGIYVKHSGSYGSKMYFATASSWSNGPIAAIEIDHAGLVNIVRSNLRVTSGNIHISHPASKDMSTSSSNPQIVFSDKGSLPVQLMYTDSDSYREPAGLKVLGDQGGEWFEVSGKTYSAGFVKTNSSDSYVLLGGGGHKALSTMQSEYDSRYVNVSGDTMTGHLAISNGGELRLKAPSSASTDPGDIVFQNSSGTEIGRIFKPAGTNAFNVRFSSSDAAKVLIHSGNYTDYTVTKTGGGAGGTWSINITGNASTATNADKLDGYHETDFFRYRGYIDVSYVDIDVYTSGDSRFKKINPGIYSIRRSNYGEMFISFAKNTGSTSSLELKTSYSNNDPIYVRKVIDANRVSGAWKQLAFTDSDITGNAASATKVYVNQHTGNDVEYPLVWSNQQNNTVSLANLLFKSYSNLTYNPAHNRITATTFRSGSSTFLKGVLELYGGTPYIDFHYNNATSDYTSRIIEGLEGLLTVTGKLRVGLGYSTSTNYKFYVNGSTYSSSLDIGSKAIIDSNGYFYPAGTNKRTVGVYGVYDSYKVGHVWSIGTGYKISADGSNTGNIYGLVYFHTNWSADSAYNKTTRDGALITEVSSYAGSHLVALACNGRILASLGDYVWSRNGFKKNGSSNSYVLLGGGGHKSISSFQTTYDSRYVIKTGDTMTGRLTMSTAITDHTNPTHQCLVINSAAIPEGTTLTLKNAPGIGFHISSYSWGSLVFNGKFNFINNTSDGYMDVNLKALSASTTINANNQRFNYGLAYYNASASTTTGTIVITLPRGWITSMNTYEIDIYEYREYDEDADNVLHSKLIIDGYNYSGSSKWVNYGYTQIGPYNRGVRLGYNGSKCVIMLGTTSSSWSYVLVHLSRVITGYGNPTSWSTGYSISVITDESSYSAIVTANRLRQRFADVVANTFRGTLSGRATSVGDGTMIMYPQYNNEINFGGSNAASTIYFGYRATDSKPIPTKFVFGGNTGTATLKANNFESGSGISDFSAGTVKLDTLNIPTSSGGTTFGPGTNGQVLKSNGTTVYWASDNNSTYNVYGKTIGADFTTQYRTQTKGNSNGGWYISAIRNNTASVTNAPLYGSGIAFGVLDTHGYLYMNYSSAAVYIGAGNADKLNWTATLLHSGNYTTYTDSRYVNVSGDTMTGNLTMSNSSLYFGSNGTGASTTGNETRLPSHIYRNVYDTSGNVYDHYYNSAYTASTNSLANLRVKSGSTFKTLSFGGNGTFTWNGNTVWHAGNDGSGSGLDADTVDGLHVSKAGNTKPWGTIVSIGTDGVSEMGKYIDFHFDNTTGSDYSTRIECSSANNIYLNLPSVSGTLALVHLLDGYVKKSGDWMTGTLNFNDNIGLFGQMAGGTDHWEIKGSGTSDNGRLKIQVHDNATTDAMDFEFVDCSGAVYTPLSMTGLGAKIVAKPTPGNWISGKTEASIKYQNLTAIDSSSFWKFYSMKSQSGNVVCYGGLGNTIGFYGYYAATTANRTDWSFTVNTANGNWTASASLYAAHFYENSDEQLKTNIQEILNSDKMPIIKEFDWKEDNSHSYGLIAQELEEQGYSELVSIKDNGYKTVNYSAALSLIVGKLQVKIKELEKEIENLKNKN